MIFWLKKKSNLKPIDKDQRQQCETLDGLKVISTEFVPDDYNGIVLECKDGYVTSCAIFRNGKKNGKQEFYDREGRTTSTMGFKDGQLHGRRQEWLYNNCIEIDEHYENGELNGTYFETNWKLNTSEGGTYRNGKKFGIWHYFKGKETYKKMTFENGIIVNEEKIIN